MSWKFIIVFKFWIDVVTLIPGTLSTEITPQVLLIVVVVLSMITNQTKILKAMEQRGVSVSRIVRLIKDLCDPC